ncbi:HAD family hydrolase [Bacteroidota bacterium]
MNINNNNNNIIRILVSDLDGTLLDNKHHLSQKNKETFRKLGDFNVIRVIATGRNLYSFRKVIPDDMAIDYLVFSSGAGIMNWKNNELLTSVNLKAKEVSFIADHFRKQKINFMLQAKMPENHHFVYHSNSGHVDTDFNRRLKLYEGYAKPLDWNNFTFTDASQFLVILPDDMVMFEEIKSCLKKFKVIRATSPIDRKSIWMEIFPKQVSKANAIKFLCKKLNIGTEFTCGFGNDYNDIDLLDFTNQSYIVSNAPEILKKRYQIIDSNEENAVSTAIHKLISQGQII